MRTSPWCKTIEGKLPLGVIGLLVVLGVAIAHGQQQLSEELAAESPIIRQSRDLKAQSPATKFTEQQTLSAVEPPPEAAEEKPSDTAPANSSESDTSKSKSETSRQTTKEHKSYFDRLKEWLRR